MSKDKCCLLCKWFWDCAAKSLKGGCDKFERKQTADRGREESNLDEDKGYEK